MQNVWIYLNVRWILNIDIWFSYFKYIRYSYSANLLRMNIFDICIWSGWEQWIYSIFVFVKVTRNEYIRYSYSVKSFYKNILICKSRPTGARNSPRSAQIWIKLVENLLYEGGGSSKVCVVTQIYSNNIHWIVHIRIQIFNFLVSHIFDIRIRLGC